MVAVSHGLPCVLNIGDFDVQPLCEEDFDEQPGLPSHAQQWRHSRVEIAFSIQAAKVAEALHHIHTSFFVRQRLQSSRTGSIAERESHLLSVKRSRQDPSLQFEESEFSSRDGDGYTDQGIRLCLRWLDEHPERVAYNVDDVQRHEFWPGFLHILFL